jgi:hypothetical protein
MKHFKSFLFSVIFLGGCLVTLAQELADNVDARFQGIKSISVEGVFCDVSVEPNGSGTVHLEGEIRCTRDADDYAIKTSQSGSELKVWVEHPNNIRGNVKGFLMFQAPENVLLVVKNVSGNVKVNKIVSDGMVLESVSGDIKISGAGKDTRLQTVSGNIDASVLNGALKAKSVSGDLRIANIKGELSCHSTSGNVAIKMVEGETGVSTTSGDLVVENLMNGATLKSTSGSVRVNVLKGDLSAKTVSGDVTLNDITGQLNLSTISGQQRGTKIMLTGDSRFNSVSGDIEMDLDNQIDVLSFELHSGSGNLVAGSSRADDKLIIDHGGFIIRGSSTSGNQTFR